MITGEEEVVARPPPPTTQENDHVESQALPALQDGLVEVTVLFDFGSRR